MSARSLASALKDFGSRTAPAAEPFFLAPAMSGSPFEMPAFDDAMQMPAVDTDAMMAAAVAAAEEALSARLAEEHGEALTFERDRHAEELAALGAQVADEASARMQAAIDEMERRIVELTSAVAARILGAVVTDDVRDRSLERLADTIREALHDNDALRVRVRGSLPLYESLKGRLSRHAEQLDFTESAIFDLSVTIDDSVFETRLAEWSAALAEALA